MDTSVHRPGELATLLSAAQQASSGTRREEIISAGRADWLDFVYLALPQEGPAASSIQVE